MNGLSDFIYKLIIKPLYLNDFTERRYDSEFLSKPNDYFTNDKLGGVWVEYRNDKNERVAYIRYYTSNGQIGLFFIDPQYQNRGLGKQILKKASIELIKHKCEEVWVVTSKDHPFWSNVNKKSFTYRNPAHPSVTSDGYFRKLPSWSI